MRTIKLPHRYWFFSIIKDIEIPEIWDDLTDRQFKVCAEIHVKEVDEIDFISQFFNVKKRFVKRFSNFELYKLTELTGFALNPTAIVNFFFMQEIPGTNLIAPLSKLKNISIEHFAFFDTYFFDYANNPTDENLNQFVAALYLKKKEEITSIDFENRVNLIAQKVDKSTQYAIFLNYIFIRNWLSRSFPFVFEKNEETEEKTRKRKYVKPTKQSRPDWNGIIDGLVGDDILHYDDYTAMRCLLAFKTINNRIKNYKKNVK